MVELELKLGAGAGEYPAFQGAYQWGCTLGRYRTSTSTILMSAIKYGDEIGRLHCYLRTLPGYSSLHFDFDPQKSCACRAPVILRLNIEIPRDALGVHIHHAMLKTRHPIRRSHVKQRWFVSY